MAVMTRIIAGVFDDNAAADRSIEKLHDVGFADADIERFAVNPPGRHHRLPLGGDQDADEGARGGGLGALAGAALGGALGAVAGLVAVPLVGPAAIAGGLAAGAYAGSLAGAVNAMGGPPQNEQPVTRPAGVMLAVNTEFGEDEEIAIDLMREKGARMVERADGSWING